MVPFLLSNKKFIYFSWRIREGGYQIWFFEVSLRSVTSPTWVGSTVSELLLGLSHVSYVEIWFDSSGILEFETDSYELDTNRSEYLHLTIKKRCLFVFILF